MEQKENLNREIKDKEKKDVEFISFSEIGEDNTFRETYGYFEKSDMARMVEEIIKEQEEKKIR